MRHFSRLSVMISNKRDDKNLRNSHKFKFSMKLLTFSCLICTLDQLLSQKLLRKAKIGQSCHNHKKLLQTPTGEQQKLPSKIGTNQVITCSKIISFRSFSRNSTLSNLKPWAEMKDIMAAKHVQSSPLK